MSQISRRDFENALKFMSIEKHSGEYRIKGFNLVFRYIFDCSCICLEGKIPLSLAEAIYAQHEKYSIWFDTDCHHHQSIIDHARTMIGCKLIVDNGLNVVAALEIEKQLPVEKLYITNITTDSIQGLIFIIEKVREANIINEWAIGNN